MHGSPLRLLVAYTAKGYENMQVSQALALVDFGFQIPCFLVQRRSEIGASPADAMARGAELDEEGAGTWETVTKKRKQPKVNPRDEKAEQPTHEIPPEEEDHDLLYRLDEGLPPDMIATTVDDADLWRIRYQRNHATNFIDPIQGSDA